MLTDVSEVRTASIVIALMVEAVHTSETSVNTNFNTRHSNPQDSINFNMFPCFQFW
jgi:hypothetical protein